MVFPVECILPGIVGFIKFFNFARIFVFIVKSGFIFIMGRIFRYTHAFLDVFANGIGTEVDDGQVTVAVKFDTKHKDDRSRQQYGLL